MKKRKLPKQPKSKSIAVWERYKKRLSDVVKHNKSVEAFNKKKKDNSPAAKIRKIKAEIQRIKS